MNSKNIIFVIYKFYLKYKGIILFNKNIVIAAVISIIFDSIVVQYAATTINNSVTVSVLSIITDSGIYLSSFTVLYYIDNKNRYIDVVSGRKDLSRLKHDLKKIVTALGISEVIYIITKFLSIYFLLMASILLPYQVAIMTTALAWIFYIIAVNVMIRVQKLYK